MAEKVFIKSTTQLMELAKTDDLITEHNDLSVIQGGAVGEYYHLTAAELDTLQHGFVMWVPTWVDGEYLENTMTRDGDWTMISNKTTSDRPSPQNVGDKQYGIVPGTVMSTSSDLSVVKMEHNFSFDKGKAGYIETISILSPAWDLNSVSKITITDEVSGTVNIINNPVLSPGEWTPINIGSHLIPKGSIINIEFTYYNADDASNISGGWTSNIGTGVPASQGINIDSITTPTLISMSYNDLDGTDRETELNGVSVGSIITVAEQGDNARYLTAEVTGTPIESVGSIEYPVTSIDSSGDLRNARDCSVSIDIPLTTHSEYAVNTDYYTSNQPDFATVTTSLAFDNVTQTDTNDAYGINIQFQEAVASLDWDLVASAGSGGASSTGNYISAVNPTVVAGTIQEVTYDMASGTSIDPAYGSIQVKTVVGNLVLTLDNWLDGHYVTFRIVGGSSFTVEWPVIKWIGKVEPTLTSEDVIVLWKESGTLYGSYIGEL